MKKSVIQTLIIQYISILAETSHTKDEIIKAVKNAKQLINKSRGGIEAVEAVLDYEEAIRYLSDRILLAMLEFRCEQVSASDAQ
jgi:hypothetical protein